MTSLEFIITIIILYYYLFVVFKQLIYLSISPFLLKETLSLTKMPRRRFFLDSSLEGGAWSLEWLLTWAMCPGGQVSCATQGDCLRSQCFRC